MRKSIVAGTLLLAGSAFAEDYPCEMAYIAVGDGSFAWWNSCSGQVGDAIWPRPSKEIILDILHHNPKLLIVLRNEADLLQIATTPEVQELFRAALQNKGIVVTTKQPVASIARHFTGTPNIVIGSSRQGFYLNATPDARDPNVAKAFAHDLSSVVAAMTGVPNITIDEGDVSGQGTMGTPEGPTATNGQGVCCDTSTGGANAPTDSGTPGSSGVGGGASGGGGEGGSDG